MSGKYGKSEEGKNGPERCVQYPCTAEDQSTSFAREMSAPRNRLLGIEDTWLQTLATAKRSCRWQLEKLTAGQSHGSGAVVSSAADVYTCYSA